MSRCSSSVSPRTLTPFFWSTSTSRHRLFVFDFHSTHVYKFSIIIFANTSMHWSYILFSIGQQTCSHLNRSCLVRSPVCSTIYQLLWQFRQCYMTAGCLVIYYAYYKNLALEHTVHLSYEVPVVFY